MAIEIKLPENAVDYSAREVLVTLPDLNEGEGAVLEYTVPVNVAPGHAFLMMGWVADEGEVVGAVRIAKELLGREQYEELFRHPLVDAEVLGQILQALVEKVAGVVQGN